MIHSANAIFPSSTTWFAVIKLKLQSSASFLIAFGLYKAAYTADWNENVEWFGHGPTAC